VIDNDNKQLKNKFTLELSKDEKSLENLSERLSSIK
jgi:hypothetical protein